MVATPYREELLDFAPVPNTLPPRDEDAEEAILGGILFDPEAIYRVWQRLKPEHFQISSHRDIYQACVRLAKKNRPTDFITVSSWLNDNNLLNKVGGRNKLMSLLDRTVSAVNIDNLAGMVIEKAVRKDLIQLGNETMKLGYDTFLDIEEVLESFKKKAEVIVELETVKTEEELIKSKHDRLLNKLKLIYTTVSEPSLKYMRLKYLADETNTSIPFLENLYLKSLVGNCTKLMNYSDLKQAAGSSIRRWLQQGLVPLGTTILLAADGGIGKTKLVYSLAKNLIEGTQFGDFLPTGEKRRILFYQGDEQEGDMLQSLQMLGYEEGDITEHIRVRFGWSFENMATLTQDLNEFKPDFVVFDSLSFGSRFSTIKESDSEFARPLLEASGLAAQHNCTMLFIHHANKGGEVRGTTAIRNAVSEVWRLSKDNKPDATQYDRILEIDKSRSRSSGKSYRLYFDPETLSFKFLGEEVTASSDVANRGTRGKILDYFHQNPNCKYTSEEISQLLNISSGGCRRSLGEIASDGLLSTERKPGKAYTYYLEYTGESMSNGIARIQFTKKQAFQASLSSLNTDHTQYGDQGDHGDHHLEGVENTTHDHLQDAYIVIDTAEGDQVITNFSPLETEKGKNELGGDVQPDHLCSKTFPDNNIDGDHGSYPPLSTGGDHGFEPPPPTQFVERSFEKLSTAPPSMEEVIIAALNQPPSATLIKAAYSSPLGQVKAIAVLEHDTWTFWCSFPDGTQKTDKVGKLSRGKDLSEKQVGERLKKLMSNWSDSKCYRVRQMGDDSYYWIDGCKSVECPVPGVSLWWIFETAAGDRIRVRGEDEFEVMP